MTAPARLGHLGGEGTAQITRSGTRVGLEASSCSCRIEVSSSKKLGGRCELSSNARSLHGSEMELGNGN